MTSSIYSLKLLQFSIEIQRKKVEVPEKATNEIANVCRRSVLEQILISIRFLQAFCQ